MHEVPLPSSLVPGGTDTIAAISTPLGQGGIGVVRMSGSRAFQIASMLLRDRSGRSVNVRGETRAGVRYGYVHDDDGAAVDEVVVLVMPSPRSYTREDVVEFQCHGGVAAVRRVLELTLAQGARLAEPGEFTKRAFLNGRIDLAQAEAVFEVVRASNDRALKAAVGQLQGRLSERIGETERELLSIMAEVEGGMDFPEDLPEVDLRGMLKRLECVRARIEELMADSETGRLLQEGPRVAIVGRPNVGKSSLLNRFVREERAIVTHVPGTTRDTIEERMSLRGVTLTLIDTAGFRETRDPVEKIGVEKAVAKLQGADLVLLVLDDSVGLVGDDIRLRALAVDRPVIAVVNKVDLEGPGISDEALDGLSIGASRVRVSAKLGWGMEELEKEIVRMSQEITVDGEENAFVLSARQKECLRRARLHVGEGIERLREGLPLEIVSIELKDAWEALGEITGRAGVEMVLNEVFSRFCVGK